MILSPSNLNNAYKSVKRNKGAGGVDKMELEELGDYLRDHKDSLIISSMSPCSLITATGSDQDEVHTRH
jgi:hypothetical protein